MVICKFFLQGNCKFGDYCKNDHQITDDFSARQAQQNSSILRQSHFGNQFQTQNTVSKDKPPGTTVDVNTLVKSVVNDMTVAEKGGQWFLSCYAPFKDKPLFPGFEDHSFEEIRLGYYEAKNSGTIEQYKQQLNLMLQQAIMRLKSLQNPTNDIINILRNIYNTPVPNQSNTSASVFSQKTSFGNQGNSMFPQANQNIFAKPQEQPNPGGNLFGGTTSTNIFGNQTSNLFGSIPNQTSSANIFGQNANTTMQNSNSIFGGQSVSAPVQAGSIFGGSNPTSSFSTPNNIFLANQNTNVFGQSPQSTQSSIFGSQNSTILQQPNLFNASPVSQPSTTQPSMFGVDNTNIFGASQSTQVPSQGIFGSQNSSSQVPQQPEQIFQTSPNSQLQPTNLFGVQNTSNLQPSNVFASPQSMPTSISQPQQMSVFGAPHVHSPPTSQNPSNIFGAVANKDVNSSIFQQQNISNSPFTKNNSETQSHTGSIFGTNTFNTLTQSQNEPINEEIYSKLGDLTEEEVKWFQSDDLNNLNIPEKPPTYEMCFKA